MKTTNSLTNIIVTLLLTTLFSSLSLAKSVYDFNLQTFDGKEKKLSDYKGKVLLVVNTATKCGFTPQLKGLIDLQNKYGSKGFQVLAIPSNDFKQDPGTAQESQDFMSKEYKINFPTFDKVVVKGENKHPLYKFMTEAKGGVLFNDVSWNFEKFLIGRDGQVIDRYNSMTKPDAKDLVSAIEKVLEAPAPR